MRSGGAQTRIFTFPPFVDAAARITLITSGGSVNALADDTAASLQAELDRSWHADPSVPGIVATVHAPRIGLLWSGACGGVQRGCGEPLTPAQVFRIASVTKPFTSAVALRLFEMGRLDLFAPIAPLLDSGTRKQLEAAGYAPTRIAAYHLLTHSSGMRDHGGPESGYAEAVLGDPAHVWSHAEQVECCMSMGSPLSRPGTHFSYSDTAYLILGDLLERVGDQPLHLLMRELLHFDRLGLVQTHFERHERPPKGQLRAGQYFETVDVASIDCSCDLSGGGGLVAPADELARFFRAACLGELFDHRQTLALALATPSLLFTPPRDALHSPLMRGRWIGDEPSWCHGGFWGVLAAYFPASDVSTGLSFNQARAGQPTLGVPGDPAQPSLADRLARIVQSACGAMAKPRP
jgi:D-alanyl-D-alanine carboxypeptidase